MSRGGISKPAKRRGAALAMLWLLSGLSVQAAEPAPRSLVVPVEITAGHLVAPVTFKGRRQHAMLDTGAPRTFVDQDYAARLGLGPGWWARILGRGRGKANGLDLQTVRTADIAIAGWSEPRSVGLTDLSLLRERGLPPVIMGVDLFEQWVVELDFDTRLMTLHSRKGFRAPSRALMLPVSGEDHHYFIPVSVEGGAPRAGHIDLGSDDALMLNQAYASAAGVLDGRPISSGAYAGLGVRGVKGLTAVRDLQLAAFSVTDLPTSLAPAQDPVFGAMPINLGLPLFSRFHVWMDLAGGRMWLSPRPGIDLNIAPSGGDIREMTATSPGRNLASASPGEARGFD